MGREGSDQEGREVGRLIQYCRLGRVARGEGSGAGSRWDGAGAGGKGFHGSRVEAVRSGGGGSERAIRDWSNQDELPGVSGGGGSSERGDGLGDIRR